MKGLWINGCPSTPEGSGLRSTVRIAPRGLGFLSVKKLFKLQGIMHQSIDMGSYKNIKIFLLLCLFVLLFSDPGTLISASNVMYVDDGGGNTAPYSNISMAATSIQTAIDYINNLTGANLTDAGGDNVIIYVFRLSI